MPKPTKAELLNQLNAAQARLRKLEQALLRMRQLLEMTTEALPGVVLLLDENGVITQAELSGEWTQRWQPSTLVGQSVFSLLSAAVSKSLQSALQSARSRGGSVVFQHKGLADDSRGVYEWRLVYRPSLGTLALIRRVEPPLTQHLREAPEHINRVNRLTRLSELVAGLVHELNQPLTAILHYGQGSLRRLASGSSDPGELLHATEQITSQANRALQIMQRIRRFLRGQAIPFTPVNLNSVVQEMVALLAPELEEFGAEVQLELAADLPDILGDSVQLTQVLVNLVRNALEAVAHSAAKKIVLATQRVANAVEVSVTDTGPGLSPEVQQRLFEPFFSTKSEGLGLGLAISRSLVQEHGGELIAENVASGARFRVRLPLPTTGPPS